RIGISGVDRREAVMAEEEERREAGRDELAESLADLFTSISTMIKGELEGTNNQLLLLEKMNQRVAEEYNGYGDVASGLRVFVEQLCEKNHGFEEHVQQIEKIDQQLTEFEAVVSMLDKYVSLLEKKVQSAHRNIPT
ncbi:biogenesis of lysosome-related organelles complex 1 subunit, partial [Musa troglodytarum]